MTPRLLSPTGLWGNSVLRYLVVGGLCFLVDAALLWALYEVVAVPLVIATPIAFLASFVVTYSMQRIVAFASDAKVAPSVARYATLVIFNTIATTVIVGGMESLAVGWFVGKILAVAVTTVWNYFIYRYWVFAKPKNRGANV